MARVQLVIPDEDRDRYVHQARREGLTLSAWLRTAAQQRLRQQQRVSHFEGTADLEEFFAECDALDGPAREPDWGEHIAMIDESRRRGAAGT